MAGQHIVDGLGVPLVRVSAALLGEITGNGERPDDQRVWKMSGTGMGCFCCLRPFSTKVPNTSPRVPVPIPAPAPTPATGHTRLPPAPRRSSLRKSTENALDRQTSRKRPSVAFKETVQPIIINEPPTMEDAFPGQSPLPGTSCGPCDKDDGIGDLIVIEPIPSGKRKLSESPSRELPIVEKARSRAQSTNVSRRASLNDRSHPGTVGYPNSITQLRESLEASLRKLNPNLTADEGAADKPAGDPDEWPCTGRNSTAAQGAALNNPARQQAATEVSMAQLVQSSSASNRSQPGGQQGEERPYTGRNSTSAAADASANPAMQQSTRTGESTAQPVQSGLHTGQDDSHAQLTKETWKDSGRSKDRG
ncbi:hypothetical protein CBR_g31896 [Chara braunii]|uniref:Uncharacterized protein n=1 Tax=Chara braunii TaxID=69332 RepID=A0A388LFY9_CHABU|nr:hypothetical protein CBR_g31896 [Chara braunii]|eukprot:GBG81224.1 hypothetical protein CBR_g31896 [Chara braunii]